MISAEELDLFYVTVLDLTKEAGKIIREKSSERNKYVEFKTSDKDLVTETDGQVEKLLIGNLSAKFPGHKFIGEETSTKITEASLTDAPTWIIDPIDGTTNFVHSFPHSCISIALFIKKQPVIGVVYNPVLEQLFTARKGKGAFLNGETIRVSDVRSLSKSLLMFEQISKQIGIDKFTNLIKEAHGFRALGSAALDMCMVACGAADAYFQYGLKIWDTAAAELIVTEAGGIVTDPTGNELNRFEEKILVANSPDLIKEISQQLMQTF